MTTNSKTTKLPVDDAGSDTLPNERYEDDDTPSRFVKMALESPEAKERYEATLAEIRQQQATLAEVRRAMHYTQTTLSKLLGMDQSEVSRLERRSDMLLSTLRSYIESAGGTLDLIATFPNMAPLKLHIHPSSDDAAIDDDAADLEATDA